MLLCCQSLAARLATDVKSNLNALLTDWRCLTKDGSMAMTAGRGQSSQSYHI